MNALAALIFKDIQLLARDRLGFLFATLFPIVYATAFGFMYGGLGGGPSSIPVAVVDEDDTDASRAFIEGLRNEDALDIRPMPRQEATDQVRRGKCSAYVILPEGYGDAAANLLAGQTPNILLGIDPGRPVASGMMRGILAREAFAGLQRQFLSPAVLQRRLETALVALREEPDLDPALRHSLEQLYASLDELSRTREDLESEEEDTEANSDAVASWKPFHIEVTDVQQERTGPASGFAVSFPQGVVWGLIGCAAAFSMAVASERTRGTLQRLLAAPLGRRQILAGKTIACLATTQFSAAAVLLVGVVAFGVSPHSYACLALAVVCASAAFTGVMMVLAVLGKTELSASGISWAALLVMALVGGGMMPLAMMPGWMRMLSNASPVKWAVYALEGAIWRGFSLSEMLAPCAILLGIGVGGFMLGARLFDWRNAG